MTAKPVPEHIDMRVATDEQLRTFVDAIAAAFPGELTEPRKVLAEVSRRLTELQHRREAEAGAPEGWVLVPREPTIDMASAGWDAIMAHTGFHEVDDRAEKAYRAMLAASPSSPASGVRVKAWSDGFIGLQLWRDEDNEDAITLTRDDIISLIEDYRSALGEHP